MLPTDFSDKVNVELPDLQQFYDWWKQAPDRRMFVLKWDVRDYKFGYVWVYDYIAQVGQFVKTVHEINLVAAKQRLVDHEKRQLQEMVK